MTEGTLSQAPAEERAASKRTGEMEVGEARAGIEVIEKKSVTGRTRLGE